VGCGSSASSTGGGDDDGGSGGSGAGMSIESMVGAQGVNITQVAMYQGPERILQQNGQPLASTTPLVAGRDALIRVYYQAAQEQVGAPLTARLEINGQSDLVFETQVGAGSTQEDLASTVNFVVPGDFIGEVFEYRVSLLQDGATDNPGAHHPVEGFEGHVVDGKRNTFRVMLVPFAYNADGSGRVPDLGPEQIEVYRKRLLGLYPVSQVEVAVREPVAWSNTIAPNGQGWQQVGLQLSSIRQQEKPSDDWYYYGIFNPTASIQQFCQGGCLLGVTLLNDQPADVGNEQLRLALGVGFPETGPDTNAHELGHAHGRAHANCGPGLDPGSIDPAFPYPNGGIGVWSWDISEGRLINPAGVSDIMGYCDNQWISDYNYSALLARGVNVNQPDIYLPEVDYDLLTFDGAGHATWQQQVTRRAFRGTGTVEARVDGAEPVLAHAYRYDHLPGGWIYVPRTTGHPGSIEVTVDGETLTALVP
ncbi:MAG: hypothetical protein KC731_39445, partial [Myxococcales bacterium]|nr:hypothetical protein [Myxococcales bacterium]